MLRRSGRVTSPESNPPPAPAKAALPRSRFRRFLTQYWFSLGLLVAVALAWCFPSGGRSVGTVDSGLLLHLGVVFVFFTQGLSLPLHDLLRGAKNVRLHLLIQGFTFVVIPLIGIALDAVVGRALSPELRLGLLYLAVLPSTIKTAVVFSSLAGGDTAAALFNATLSSLLGVIATPLWMGYLAKGAGVHVEFSSVLGEVVGQLVLPLLLGMLIRPFLARFIEPHKARWGHAASLVILFIVYRAFAQSFLEGTWQNHDLGTGLAAFGLALGFFLFTTWLTYVVSGWLALPRPDRITALFSAPQKTLASGAPMAEVIFAGRSDIGLILLPLLFYHPLQLLLGSVLVSLAARQGREPA